MEQRKIIFQENSILPLLADEAIVLGALESGVGFVSSYPGCPAAEIGDLFYKIQKDTGVYMEYSTNEIVALEAAAGATFSGVKALVAMKHFGMNVVMDVLIPISYTKPRAGLVVVVCDDPGCHSSAQSEQDSRVFIENLNLLTLEPADPQEARDFTKLAFEMSEKFQKPVIIRMTTRVAHQTMAVKVGKISPFDPAQGKGKFIKDIKRFNTFPSLALNQKRELLALKNELEKELAKTALNPILTTSDAANKDVGVITSGISHLYALDAFKKLNVSLPILKIDSFYPLPMEKINSFLQDKTKILIFEEILGLIEEKIRAEVQRNGIKIEISGKNPPAGRQGLMEPVGELNPDRVVEASAQFLGIKYEKPVASQADLTPRTPRFCPNCPYWLIYGTLKKAVNPDEVIFAGDIGCYMIGFNKPFELQDTLLCMGASLGIGHGISKATKQKVIAMIGDSTLFHGGLPGLINIVNNESSPLIIIFNNGITAMTGQQPNSATPLEFKTEDGKAQIEIEELLKVIGVKNIAVVDPVSENKLLEEKIKEFLLKEQASAIICRHPCVYIDHLEKMEIEY